MSSRDLNTASLRSPHAVDWATMPELIRASTLDLGGMQPVTRAMAAAGKKKTASQGTNADG
jgi:hypothetical protein